MARAKILEAVRWVLLHHAEYNIRVVNFSLGGLGNPIADTELELLLKSLEAQGIVMVAAAGNAGPYLDSVGFPGTALPVITVGATVDPGDGAETLAQFSSRGHSGLLKPDIVAPGWNIAAARRGTTDDYLVLGGTSMSSPFVAGVVALMLSANPELKPSQVKQILQDTAIRYPGITYPNPHLGYGMVDAYQAVRTARGLTGTDGGPQRPQTQVITGSVPTDPTAATSRHTIDIPADTWAIGVSVWTDRWDPPGNIRDMDFLDGKNLLGEAGMLLRTYGPDGKIVTDPIANQNQFYFQHPMAFFRPTTPGTYTLEIEHNFASEDAVSGQYTLVVTTHRGPPVSGDFGGHNIPRHAQADQVSLVDVTAINTGYQDWDPQSPTPLAISYHWRDEYGNPVIWEGLTSPVVVTVAPGKAVTQKVAVRAPAAPGRYLLELDLVQVGQEWLSCLGSGRVIVGVNVTP